MRRRIFRGYMKLAHVTILEPKLGNKYLKETLLYSHHLRFHMSANGVSFASQVEVFTEMGEDIPKVWTEFYIPARLWEKNPIMLSLIILSKNLITKARMQPLFKSAKSKQPALFSLQVDIGEILTALKGCLAGWKAGWILCRNLTAWHSWLFSLTFKINFIAWLENQKV